MPELPHTYVYTRLRPSRIHGIGVFALRRIKKNTHLFPDDKTEMVWIDEDRFDRTRKRIPKEILRLYDDFAVVRKSRTKRGHSMVERTDYGCPASFNCMTMAWYLNQPKKGQSPNVRCDPETYEFYAERDIRPGEELTVVYRTFSEEPKSHTHAGRAER
jgi:SET domain-containing protein